MDDKIPGERSQRRGNRIAMDRAELDTFLTGERVCRMATISAAGPHNSPLWFVWDGSAIWIYSIVKSQRVHDAARPAGRDRRRRRSRIRRAVRRRAARVGRSCRPSPAGPARSRFPTSMSRSGCSLASTADPNAWSTTAATCGCASALPRPTAGTSANSSPSSPDPKCVLSLRSTAGGSRTTAAGLGSPPPGRDDPVRRRLWCPHDDAILRLLGAQRAARTQSKPAAPRPAAQTAITTVESLIPRSLRERAARGRQARHTSVRPRRPCDHRRPNYSRYRRSLDRLGAR